MHFDKNALKPLYSLVSQIDQMCREMVTCAVSVDIFVINRFESLMNAIIILIRKSKCINDHEEVNSDRFKFLCSILSFVQLLLFIGHRSGKCSSVGANRNWKLEVLNI